MKQFILFPLIFTFFILVPILTVAAVEDTNNHKTILVATYHEDVTGDGQKEEIQLKGIRFSQDSSYFHNLWADIKGPQTKQWKIVYEGGYKPTLQFIDLNHDGINDVLFQSATNETSDLYSYQFNTLKNEKLTKLAIPESYTITGKFKNNFKAALTIDPSKKPIIIDMKERKTKHIHQGIYDRDGKLLKETKLLIAPITFFEPAFISKSKGYGLKSYQQVSGANHQDKLGTIEAFWYFEKGKWIKLNQEWNASN
ncbi:hypothetical protein F3157_03025 [Virgibacillus dakarensis]|uniref:VCBS repeat-containing protein n=1 Tax=Lentibacillus populi TaxID=1827502 RepID=A0A9W5X7P5_9BACI|nr:MULTISPECIES: hypothetical protein [Bacillaceae]MBT2217035.1 hypothetical protein [Virgibacillus dakarensis]MTW84629.1 hypothetical protein [Virgibacillus dakarensis]GGB61564.1 hypothetical protein GCM10011409_43490 [Lentibacillus populi]